MDNPLTRAWTGVERSYSSAKSAVSQQTETLLARGPSGFFTDSDWSKSAEQLKHFSGWVYSSIRPIAQKIAGQPVYVSRKRGGIDRRISTKAVTNQNVIANHPLIKLLADPNDLMVGWSLMFTTVASLELTGRALWWLPKRESILPIPTSWITRYEGSTKFTSFVVRPPNQSEELKIDSSECCYFSYPSPSDPHGVQSPLQAVGAAVDSDDSIQSSQRAMFRNGLHPSVALIVGRTPHPDIPGGVRPTLTGAQQNQLIGAIRKRYAGTVKHGEPLILDGLIEDVKRLSSTVAEMDFLKSGEDTKQRIMQGFGVNPIIAGQVQDANRASAQVASEHFIEFCINPKIELMSQCLTEWLGLMFDDVVVFIEPCVAHDAQMELQKLTLAAQNGCLTCDELRAYCGLPEDSKFDGQLVGGQNLQGSNPIQRGIEHIVTNQISDILAERMLNDLHLNNGRH